MRIKNEIWTEKVCALEWAAWNMWGGKAYNATF